ncbi:MFS transporter [bacterium]|nr:MFS transporter [bacterium]
MAPLAIGYGLASPSIVAILSRYASTTSQGSVLGIGTSMSAFARVVGPVTMGFVYEENKSLPFYIGSSIAILNVVVVALVLYLNRRLPEHKKDDDTQLTSPKHDSSRVLRVRLGTLDDKDDDHREVTMWEFLVRLLTKRGILKRNLHADQSGDVEEMTTLLRRSIRPIREIRGDVELAESLDAYTKAPIV